MPPVVNVSKTSNPQSGTKVSPGDIITYTLEATVENSRLEAALVLEDTLGSDLDFGAVTANNGYSVSGSGNLHQFILPLGTGPGTYRISYTARVKAKPAGTYSLKNVVVPKYDPNSGVTPPGSGPNCTACFTEHEYKPVEVKYSKTTTAVAVKDKDEILYEITVEVTKSATTVDLFLQDTFEQGVKYSRLENYGKFNQPTASRGSTVVEFVLPSKTPPGTYKLSYWGEVDQNYAGAGTGPVDNAKNSLVNSPNFTNPDNPVCKSPCETTTPIIPEKIFYKKEIVSIVPTEGVGFKQSLKFRVTVWVEGLPTSTAYVLKDTLSVGLRKTDEIPKVTAPVKANWDTANTLTIDLPIGLTKDNPYTIDYTVEVTESADKFVKNSVLPDPPPIAGIEGPRCASYCATETPVVKAEVSFMKTSTSTSAAVGGKIDYVLTVNVTKASLATDVDLMVDNLSLGLELDDASLNTGGASIIGQKNGQSLVLKLKAGVLPGQYFIKYSALVTESALSSVNNKVEGLPTPDGMLPKCDASSTNGCSVKTEVLRTIQPENDDFGSVKSSTGSSNVGNAYENDKINGNPVTLDKITGKVIAPATPVNGGTVPVLDPNTGIVSVPPGTPSGSYQIVYQICDKLVADPAVGCKTATITVKVTNSPIDAKDDSYTGNRGSGGDQEVGNAYSENDTLDGTPFSPDRITGTVITPAQPIGGDPRVPVLDVVTGKVTVPSGTPAGDYTIHYRICEKLNPSNCDDAVIKVTVKPDESLLRIVKTAAVRTVKIGDLVRYSLQVQNIGAVKVVNANVIDTAANGFTFVNGSMNAVGLGSAVTSSGVRPVQFSGVTLDVGQTGTLVYMMRVGAGVRPGNHVNTAFAKNGVGDSISNQATASVELVSDPLLDDSLIFGSVFDDRDRDGWQDSAKLTGLKAQGGFAPGAYIANSTTVDKGQGAEPQADASSPLLHGLDLGSITARQSEADPVAKHTVLIHQKLQSLDFTDDFVLTNDQGVTVRMNAAGQTIVEKSGEAAAGRNAAQIEVERKISQTAEGYGVDYIIRSTGIDERGIPGVRVASVEGLLMETDPFGRYHLVGVNGGRWERGRHFILKVDPSTLPAGAEFTTSNPLLRRITPGLPVRFDFGVQLNPEFMAGEQKTAEIELGSVLFAAGSTEIRSQYLGEQGVIAQVAAKLQQYRGGELLISANGESEAVAFARAEAVRKAVIEQLPAEVQGGTKVSVRRDANDANSLISGVTANGAVLGNVLFETDKSVVRPEYQALLAKVGAYLNAQGVNQGASVVSIVGHTDVRASHAYNQKLGLARAKAVYEALLPHLSEDLKKHLQVQAEADNALARRPVPKAASH